MKCEIIRDLFPSYLDGLTSEASNDAIQEHLEGCEPCKEILEQMKQEPEIQAEPPKKKINPFRKFNRRMKGAVLGAVVACVCLGGVGYKGFAQGFDISPKDITMDVRTENDILYLDFSLENGNLMHYGSIYDESSAEIRLRKVWELPGDDLGEHPNEFSWGMNLKPLAIGKSERMEVEMQDGALGIVEMEEMDGEDAVIITNNDAEPSLVMMFQEDDAATSFVIGGGEKVSFDQYTITIDYGEETESYTVAELLEMAK